MRRRYTLVPVLIVLALLLSAMPAAARAPIAIGVSNPEGGGPALAEVQAAVYAHKAQIGRFPKMWSLWSKWGHRAGQVDCVRGKGSCAFPKEAVKWLHSKGITPVVWWLPTDPGDWEAGKYERYKRILNGKHNKYIKQWARDLKGAASKSGKPVIVRFAHEATGHWFPWSIDRFDNTRKNYKAAWRYIWKQFKYQGAMKHTRFMWSMVWPYAWAYPGDKYIDYVGITVLNFGKQRKWKPAKSLIDQRGKASLSFTRKPIIIAEMATHYLGGNKASWIRNAYAYAYKNPKIKGIMYLDTDEPHKQKGQPDWRLVKPDNRSAIKAYKAVANQAKFRGRIK